MCWLLWFVFFCSGVSIKFQTQIINVICPMGKTCFERPDRMLSHLCHLRLAVNVGCHVRVQLCWILSFSIQRKFGKLEKSITVINIFSILVLFRLCLFFLFFIILIHTINRYYLSKWNTMLQSARAISAGNILTFMNIPKIILTEKKYRP